MPKNLKEAVLPTLAPVTVESARLATLKWLLDGDLEFHGEDSSYASHNFHAFAAKFPPQLPAIFVKELTGADDVVLDPMMGSGTTVLEAAIAGRRAVGYDIDPLALLLCKVKTTPISDLGLLEDIVADITLTARNLSVSRAVEEAFAGRFDKKTRDFLDYWFLPETQRELMSLALAIEGSMKKNKDSHAKEIMDFLLLAFSSIIVTKSGGVTMARDLAHGRPHRVMDKKPRNAVDMFVRRALKNIKGIDYINSRELGRVSVHFGDARNIKEHQEDHSVDLIVTSPPYANAIDYMRAHKFSLVWFGRTIDELGSLRSTYIGSERIGAGTGVVLPGYVEDLIGSLSVKDAKQAKVLRKYYVEMKDVLTEMHRVLKADSVAVMVVGSSTMRGIDVMTHECLAEIAVSLDEPFVVAGVMPRRLDRNKRMMPARFGGGEKTGIEQRMHEEYILGLYKPRNPRVM